MLDNIAYEGRSGERADDPLVAVAVHLAQMVEHAGEDAAGAAGRGRDYGASGCIFLTYGEGVCEYQPPCPKHILVAFCPDEIVRCLSSEVKRTGKDAFLVQPPFN